jgi:hypothetical protein
MGLWLKCPSCQTRNLLGARICSSCGSSLENLPPDKRVYILEPPGSPAPKPAPSRPPAVAPAEAAAAAPAAAKKARGPKQPRKKKHQS